MTGLPEFIVDRLIVGDCWEWTGTRSKRGYGRISWNGQLRAVHRVIYEILVGPVPLELELDHLCRNRSCVNPDHLEPVTGKENRRRGQSFSALNARQMFCHQGHPLAGDNLVTRTNGHRNCRTCEKARQRAAYRKATQ